MKRLNSGNRIRLSGGYDMDPEWLQGDHEHFATVIRFIHNKIPGRKREEELSVVIRFDKEIVFEGLTGQFGIITGRYEDQTWEPSGVVGVQLLSKEIMDISELTQENSRGMESHASYKVVDG